MTPTLFPTQTDETATTHDVTCSWVPGTTNVVRVRLGNRIIELTSTRLQRIFGHKATADLYLKGRAHLKASAQQLALLS